MADWLNHHLGLCIAIGAAIGLAIAVTLAHVLPIIFDTLVYGF